MVSVCFCFCVFSILSLLLSVVFSPCAARYRFYRHEDKDERRKEKFREDKRFYRLPTKRLCVLRALSAAEAKTSMTLRIFLPAFSSPLSLFCGIFFCSPREIFLTTLTSLLSLSLFLLFIHSAQVRVNHDCAQPPPSRSTRRRSRRPSRFWTRVLSATSLGTYLGLTFGILGSTLSLPWLIFILICQRTPDYAPKDDVTEVDESRATLAFACIAVAFLILLPGASLTPSDLGPMDF